MAKSEYYVGMDIGSSAVRAIITQEAPEGELLRVIGVGVAPVEGVRRGMVVDAEKVTKACNEALDHAERMAGHRMERVTVGVSGTDIGFQMATGVVAVGRADGEVAEGDLGRALEEARSRAILSANQEVMHIFPKEYRLDDQKNLKDPIGLRGVRLEVSAFVVAGSAAQVKNVTRAVEMANVSVDALVAEPLAAGTAVLSSRQKELGVALVNIGSSTTSVAVFEEGDLLHLAVLPVGAGHITNDLAIGLRTSVDVAEAVKLRYGTAIPDEVGKKEEVDLALFDPAEEGAVSRHHIAEIIEARLEELFGFVNDELGAVGREGLLPAGVVLTGGGALLPGVAELAKRVVRLPVQIGYPKPLGGILDQVDSPQFSTVVGLVLTAQGGTGGHSERIPATVWGVLPETMRTLAGRAKRWVERFFP